MWTRRDFGMLAACAVGTFALTVGVLWTPPLGAVDGAEVTKKIEAPTYRVGTCDVTIRTAEGQEVLGTKNGMTFLNPGELPRMEMVIHNTSHEKSQGTVKVQLTRTTMRDSFSRVPRVRQPDWSEEYSFEAGPEETKVVALKPPAMTLAKLDQVSVAILLPVAAGEQATVATALPNIAAQRRAIFTSAPTMTLLQMSAAPLPAEEPAAQQTAMVNMPTK